MPQEVDPGETYFVEGVLTKGVVIGAADLEPSNRPAFDKASKSLKLAPRIAAETTAPPEATPPEAVSGAAPTPVPAAAN